MQEQIIQLASELVKIPSRAGTDQLDDILSFLLRWMQDQQVDCQVLRADDGRKVGLYVHIRSGQPGPALCLNACIDTAPFGDESAWSHSPTAAALRDGRLYGRGAADSKIAVAIFSHLAAKILRSSGLKQGELFVVFDAEEHSGEFTGIKRFLETAPRKPDAVFIGYPGNKNLVVGSRGFARAIINVHGKSAHSGSKSVKGFNAIQKMARLVDAIYTRDLPKETLPDFSFGAEVNVTEIKGGEGFSVIPDLCTCKVDMRLTPNINQHVAREWLEELVRGLDTMYPDSRATEVTWLESWPAYAVSRQSLLVTEFLEVAESVFGRPIQPVISGPSNIGNYLASRHIPAFAGFGVTYGNLHATDEYIEVDTILPVFETYARLVERLTAVTAPLDGDSLLGE